MFLISSKVTFSVLFVLFKAEITVSKLTLHLMGKMFNIRVGKIRFGIWRVTFLRIFILFYHLKTLECTCGFCAVDDLPRAHWDETEFIVFQYVLKFPEVPVKGNETWRLVKFVDLCRKWINKRETWHILRRDIAAASLKILYENFNPVNS